MLYAAWRINISPDDEKKAETLGTLETADSVWMRVNSSDGKKNGRS